MVTEYRWMSFHCENRVQAYRVQLCRVTIKIRKCKNKNQCTDNEEQLNRLPKSVHKIHQNNLNEKEQP